MATVVPQNPSYRRGEPAPRSSDCAALADFVAQIGVLYDDPSKIRDSLFERFNNRDRRGFAYNEFNSTGFRDQFRDDTGPGNSPNQVYHYVGAFRAGFSLGATAGSAVMENHENQYVALPVFPYIMQLPDTPSHRADKALNGVAVQHGADLASGRIKPNQLADAIRREVCR